MPDGCSKSASRALLQRIVLIVAAVFVAAGCAPTPHVVIKTTPDTNEGAPIHMMIRTADERTAVTDGYDEVADMAYKEERDPSVVSVEVLIPGASTVRLPVELEEEADIILYFFFTTPGGRRWFVPIRAPIPEEIYVELGENTISRVQVRR